MCSYNSWCGTIVDINSMNSDIEDVSPYRDVLWLYQRSDDDSGLLKGGCYVLSPDDVPAATKNAIRKNGYTSSRTDTLVSTTVGI